ncbi:dihydrofolate reductase family protein [Aporhodopirellula aestuarii]|uniref:Dihydrofolate reductase family protein n=1 Tax=Aporhodopirellula aestuarii TaxID=2950107 RepID=A0ABT0TXM7_9BACT|nr:dihydrofolate reductase family protein [Aporhodopirellula aestuarii]MCM2369129.1 dihydrofolate reductase family protein [Aporhodopirellula aestuarii]
MPAKSSVFIATSLDGYIARPDGSLDWLDQANRSVPAEEDCGYHAFMKSVDVLVMGRHTYETVRSFGNWPYGNTPVIVLSRNPLEIPDELSSSVSHSSESPADLHRRLSNEGAKHLYIDGGTTIQEFLRAGVIDELTITVIPVLIGSGIPLFGSLPHDIRLIHRNTTSFDFGFVQSTYQVQSNCEA